MVVVWWWRWWWRCGGGGGDVVASYNILGYSEDTVRTQRPVLNNATATAAAATPAAAADNATAATAAADILGLRHPMPQHFYLYLYLLPALTYIYRQKIHYIIVTCLPDHFSKKKMSVKVCETASICVIPSLANILLPYFVKLTLVQKF